MIDHENPKRDNIEKQLEQRILEEMEERVEYGCWNNHCEGGYST